MSSGEGNIRSLLASWRGTVRYVGRGAIQRQHMILGLPGERLLCGLNGSGQRGRLAKAILTLALIIA
jgi:hypothetical protein